MFITLNSLKSIPWVSDPIQVVYAYNIRIMCYEASNDVPFLLLQQDHHI